MKKILGLDLGSSSIGWAFIEENTEKSTIKRLGVRVIPYTGDEKYQFSKGQAISVNKDRTLKRTARKTNFRYKLRKKDLIDVLSQNGMMPDEDLLKKITPFSLNELRSKAATEKITLPELGRIFFLLNQKRGYKSSRAGNAEEESGKKISDYLNELKERKELLKKENFTIGQYFFHEFQSNPFFQTRKKVFPRECYINEFDRLWETQRTHHPVILTDDLKKVIRDEIIYYQRRLKSQKGLVGECRFELHHKVAPKSSPLFQLEKIWESINAISLTNKFNKDYPLSLEQKKRIFEHLDEHEKLNQSELLKLLDLKRTDGWHPNEQIKKAGLQGNLTKATLLKEFKRNGLEDKLNLLDFDIIQKSEIVDHETGEVTEKISIKANFEKEPLYQLWHLLYSVDDADQLKKVLQNRYDFTQEQAEAISKIDFKKAGFGNKSAKALRKLLPGLMQGMVYSVASENVGYKHSDSQTTEDNQARILKEKLVLYAKNSLRQPVVEKILNQLINLVNNIISDPELGRPDEIRVELARELKQSKEERNRSYSQSINSDKTHKEIATRINTEFPGLKVTRKLLEKYKLYEQQNGICIYSGEVIELSQVLRGEGVDVDHIIPQSRLFDDSFQNKVLTIRIENENKDKSTAYDYMNSKSEEEFKQYIGRVDRLFNDEKITKSKRDKLLMAGDKIPDDFINRQLNETRYISRESIRLLKDICFNVFATSGSVTEFLRNQWGYNEVLQQLNWHKYEAAGKTANGKIEGWSKRDDHRHHAIDALVVATTKQSFIQRLNKLNSTITRQELLNAIQGKTEEGWQAKRSLLEQYIQVERPFNTQEVKEAVSQIFISIKPGKKVATLGRNHANNQKTFTPRGQLHKEQVYGKIKRYSVVKTPLNGRFDNVDLISNPKEKELVKARLSEFDNDPKKAFKDLTNKPIWLDDAKTKSLSEVTLWEEIFVYKYTLDQNFKEKDIESIIDVGVKEKVRQRFTEKAGQKEHPLKNLDKEPIWLNESKKIPITSVRCKRGLNEPVPLHMSNKGLTYPAGKAPLNSSPIDFVSTRNNHHIAIYEKPDGNLEEIIISLWEAVERKKYKIPVIIKDTTAVWDFVLNKGIDNQNVLRNIPLPDWKYITSLQQNELFVFRMSKDEIINALKMNEKAGISNNLYRVQKIAEKYYVFRHQLETKLEKQQSEEKESITLGKMIRINSLDTFKKLNPIKIRINAMGNISIMDS